MKSILFLDIFVILVYSVKVITNLRYKFMIGTLSGFSIQVNTSEVIDLRKQLM